MNLSGSRTLLAAFFIWTSMLLGGADPPRSKVAPAWYRGLNLSAPVNPRVEPFDIVGIKSEDGNHLIGEFVYFNHKAGDKSPPPVTIRGSKKADGTFWPHALAQVANEINSQWTTIGGPETLGAEVSLVFRSEQEKQRFYVDLDLFRPTIGKMKYGKIILETGDSAIFEIKDLLPP